MEQFKLPIPKQCIPGGGKFNPCLFNYFNLKTQQWPQSYMFIISSNALVTALAEREARGGFENKNHPRNFSISNVIVFFLPNYSLPFRFQSFCISGFQHDVIFLSVWPQHSLLRVFGNNRKITVETYMQFCNIWISATPLAVPAQEQTGRTATMGRVCSLWYSPECEALPKVPSKFFSET